VVPARLGRARCQRSAGLAQQNIDKLKQMKVASTDLNIPPVPQTGKQRRPLRENLKSVKLPPGFKIDLYAVVPDARHMAVAPSTNMLFVGTRKTTVWAVTDRNSDGVADEVKAFAPSLKFSVPNGVCWTKDGFLIVVEHNRVLNFPAAEFFYEGPDVAVIEAVPQGKLIPPRRSRSTTRAHLPRRARTGCSTSRSASLSTCSRARSCSSTTEGGHRRHRAHEPVRRLQARGLCHAASATRWAWSSTPRTNASGSPTTRPTAWATTSQRRDQPRTKAASSSATRGSGQDRITEVRLRQGPAAPNVDRPDRCTWTPTPRNLGLVLLHRQAVPGEVPGRLFSAQHGSWNRTKPIGARVMFTSLKADGTADKTEVFAEAGSTTRPAPTAAAGRRRGDEGRLAAGVGRLRGALYRITYSAP
jgi:glucose/arabinose dehydrogenase